MLKIKTTVFLMTTALIASGCTTYKTTIPATVNPPILEKDSALALDFETNVGNRVFFGFDSSQLSEKTKAQLKKQIAWLAEHPNIAVNIQGHCDERGSDEYNLALGYKRAEEIKKFFLNHGIASSRIEVVTYGKDRPAALGHNKEVWKQNRRGVIFVIVKTGSTDLLYE